MPEQSKDTDYDPNYLPDILPVYYKRLFPYGPYFKWLSYGGVQKSYFQQREFSFTLKDDVYIRYQSFSDQSELEKEIQKKCPYKIDVGAVFSHKPKEHKTVKAAAFQAQEKEVVFDIDMTDYDDVRNCCSGADICKLCWPLMQIAVEILDQALREDFGFDHLLWVYSGRRGVHCWVCDESARSLSQNGRSAVAEYLNIVKGGDSQVKKVTLSEHSIHPSISRAIDVVEQRFEEYAVRKQDFLADDERVEKVLAIIYDEELRQQLLKDFDTAECKSSRDRWSVLQKRSSDLKKDPKRFQRCSMFLEEIMLQYCYPRLDINVSKGLNHLLKSPFCVHPKTGRVCVPMDPENMENFDPFKVPTISQLCDELNVEDSSSGSEDSKRKVRDYKHTSLKPSIAVFDEFLRELETTWRGKRLELSDAKQEF